MSSPAGLHGKRIVVTAGAAGIGRSIAEAFLEAGARVHVCDVDPAALAALDSAAVPSPGFTRADVADVAQVDQLFEDVARSLGGLDVLVNNAGIAGPTGPVEAVSPEDWRRTLAVNLDGAFLCSRRAVSLLKQSGAGSIVNIASSAALFGYPMRAPYAASKWALLGLTKTLAMELGPFGIRVNAICPGGVDGPRIDRVIEEAARARGVPSETIRQTYLRQTSLRTFVRPEDVASLALFLCSDAGARISGQSLAVDGHTESLSVAADDPRD